MTQVLMFSGLSFLRPRAVVKSIPSIAGAVMVLWLAIHFASHEAEAELPEAVFYRWFCRI
jgi:hypothetical protein